MGMQIGRPLPSSQYRMSVREVTNCLSTLKSKNVLFVIAIFDDRDKGSYG